MLISHWLHWCALQNRCQPPSSLYEWKLDNHTHALHTVCDQPKDFDESMLSFTIKWDFRPSEMTARFAVCQPSSSSPNKTVIDLESIDFVDFSSTSTTDNENETNDDYNDGNDIIIMATTIRRRERILNSVRSQSLLNRYYIFQRPWLRPGRGPAYSRASPTYGWATARWRLLHSVWRLKKKIDQNYKLTHNHAVMNNVTEFHAKKCHDNIQSNFIYFRPWESPTYAD